LEKGNIIKLEIHLKDVLCLHYKGVDKSPTNICFFFY